MANIEQDAQIANNVEQVAQGGAVELPNERKLDTQDGAVHTPTAEEEHTRRQKSRPRLMCRDKSNIIIRNKNFH